MQEEDGGDVHGGHRAMEDLRLQQREQELKRLVIEIPYSCILLFASSIS